jgi:stage III sporulation protein SpoIIIAA
MVPCREQQAEMLVQAVQNHNPDVIIVDEIGTKQVGLTTGSWQLECT